MHEYSPADYAEIAERMQHAALFRRRFMLVVIAVLVVYLRKSARSARDLLGFIMQLIEYALREYSLADYAEVAERECSMLHYFAEKDS